MNNLKLGCAVLTAGNASQSRDSLPDGRCMILQALAAVPARAFETVVVVTPYPEIMRRARDFHFAALCSAGPDRGIRRAVVLGLTGLRDCDGIMFLPGGQPAPRAEEVTSLAEKWRDRPQKFLEPANNGLWLFPSRFYQELLQAVL